jgi:hypothetical protein
MRRIDLVPFPDVVPRPVAYRNFEQIDTEPDTSVASEVDRID